MKPFAALFLMLGLGGLSSCQREDDFTARFEKTDEKLKVQAGKINDELSVQLKDAPNATQGAADTDTAAAAP